MVPRIPDGVPRAGTSITIGPSDRPMKPRKQMVSQLAVKNSNARVHQLREEQDGVVFHADIQESLMYCLSRCRRERAQEGIEGVDEVEMVVQLLGRLRLRRTISELERAKPALHRVRRRERREGLSGHCVLAGGGHVDASSGVR
jgi:hypothetical protein